MAAKYRYYIDFDDGNGEQEIIPDQDIEYVWEKPSETAAFNRKKAQEFTITKDYDNEGTFINEDVFDTLWAWWFDSTKHQNEITFKVYRNGVEDYVAVFYVLDGSIDMNDGFYTIAPEPDDQYRVFLQYIENEINIITSGDYNARLVYVPTLESGTGTTTTPPPNDSSVSDAIWNSTWIQDPHTLTTWWRLKSQYEIFSGQGKLISGWYYYPDLTTSGYEQTFSFPNCFLLTERIQYLIDTMLNGTSLDGAITFVSQFFNVPYNPVNADLNYVTGNINHLSLTLIEHNSDAKDPDATNKATIGRISFKQLMDDLNSMYNVKWYIENGELIIEHQKYFDNGLKTFGTKGVCIDLTDQSKYIDETTNEYYILDSQKLEKVNVSRAKRESILFGDAETNDFRTDLNYIEYQVISTEESVRNKAVSQFNVDFAKLINNTEDVYDDGFYLFNCYSGSVDSRPPSTPPDTLDVIEKQELDGTDEYGRIANAGFSSKWLLYNYYKHGRQDKSGTLTVEGSIGGDDYEVLTSVPLFIQKDIVFKLNDSDTIDINEYIATYLVKSDGVRYKMYGKIIDISHDLNTDFVTATLGFEI